jgi:SAM-dependent methyltransferase
MTAAGKEYGAFSGARLARLAEIENEHFWFVARRELILGLLARHVGRSSQLILDVGCGAGGTLRALQGRGHALAGLDLRPEGLRWLRNDSVAEMTQGEATRLPFRDSSVAAVLLLDVLEHVREAAALDEVWRVLRPGGCLVLSVPALPALWSYRDEAAGHLRRYTRPHLLGALKLARFDIREVTAYQSLLLPALLLSRRLGRNDSRQRDLEDKPGRMINRVLTTVNRLEVRLGVGRALPWGSSLMAAAWKAPG